MCSVAYLKSRISNLRSGHINNHEEHEEHEDMISKPSCFLWPSWSINKAKRSPTMQTSLPSNRCRDQARRLGRTDEHFILIRLAQRIQIEGNPVPVRHRQMD